MYPLYGSIKFASKGKTEEAVKEMGFFFFFWQLQFFIIVLVILEFFRMLLGLPIIVGK